MIKLYEILVPTKYGDNEKPIRTAHHKEFDKRVHAISGGLTILKPAFGKWVFEGRVLEEKVIPVRIACTDAQIKKIMKIALEHYRQLAVMAYKLSDEVLILERK